MMLHNVSRHAGNVGRWCQRGKLEPFFKVQYVSLVTGTMTAVNGQVPQGFRPHQVNQGLPVVRASIGSQVNAQVLSVGSGATSTASRPQAAVSAVSSALAVPVASSTSTLATR